MADRLIIFDTTLRDGEQSPGATMNLPEKIRMAEQLEKLGVDVIEAGFAASSPGDFESVNRIAATIKTATVASLARCNREDIFRAWQAVQVAAHPRLHVFLATSPLHMRHKLEKTPEQVLESIATEVSYAASLCPDVEFSAEDASRSEPDFLVRAFDTAMAAGASTLNIPDTVGYALPEEFAGLVRYIMERVRQDKKVIFSVHCHNDLGLATANSLAAVRAGARQVEGTVSGIGERAGNACIEEVTMTLRVREDYYNCLPGIVTEQIYPTCRMLSHIIGQPIPLNKPVSGDNAFAHEAGIHQDGVMKKRETYEIMSAEAIGRSSNLIVLGKHSGRSALRRKLEDMGYSLADRDVDVVFAAVKELADRKEEIFDEDVEALVLEKVYRVPDHYVLLGLQVQSGNASLQPTAAVSMEARGRRVQKAAFGAGPVDAAFNAVCSALKRRPKLESYLVNAVTGGMDALGEVTVRISENGLSAVGRGAHVDIIQASALAMVNALNRLTKKEEEER
ncbi:MAG: 2-isopropylmalate synthase [Deltaproteobacteria bacterium]|jgi:2-isopropylmalate synthase|nr:2-isopropylmalate synthase [Deltaproteobacteria bacterium]